MGKKRKASGRASDEAIRRDVDPSDAKLRLSTYKDVADSEDEFHLNRDKVLLDDGPDRKRQRRQEEEGSNSIPKYLASTKLSSQMRFFNLRTKRSWEMPQMKMERITVTVARK